MKRRMHASGFNPFVPPPGELPTLAGREEESTRIEYALSRLLGERVPGRKNLKYAPYPPIRIVGPQGVGKTAMLAEAEKKARENGINVVSCAGPRPAGKKADAIQHVLDVMVAEGLLPELTQKFGLNYSVTSDGFPIKRREAYLTYMSVVGEIIARTNLLLLLDDAHHYCFDSVALLMQINQQRNGEGYPLGLICAATTELDRYLRSIEAKYMDINMSLRINALSDDETREALRTPFESAGVAVTPAALEALAAQADGHPRFIQLLGQAAWQALEETGGAKIDAGIAAKAVAQAKGKQQQIYRQIHRRIEADGLLPYAERAIDLIEAGGGEIHMDRIIGRLLASHPGMERNRAHAIQDGLHDGGLLCTLAETTAAAIPSLFGYFKARRS